MSVFRSNRGISAQLIDDERGHTVAAVNWTEPELRELPRMDQARRAGELLAARAREAGYEAVTVHPDLAGRPRVLVARRPRGADGSSGRP